MFARVTNDDVHDDERPRKSRDNNDTARFNPEADCNHHPHHIDQLQNGLYADDPLN
jgi:hypothetical protein